MAQRVKVSGAPGYVEEFEADLVPGLHEVQTCDPGRLLSIVILDGIPHPVDSKHVTILEG